MNKEWREVKEKRKLESKNLIYWYYSLRKFLEMKKANAPIKFDSDDTEGSDLSYESSFDEKEDNQGSTST